MRLFVSVDLPDRLAESVAAVQEPFAEASGVRPTDPEQAHVTLKFLGEVPETTDGAEPDLETTVAAVERGVEDAAVEPFDVALDDVGAFPSLEYISVVWLGVGEGADPLTSLHEAIEAEAVAAGFSPEDHEFTPHVTIGRMDHAGGKGHVQKLLAERSPSVGRFRVEAVRLTESTLQEDGPVYETVERFEL